MRGLAFEAVARRFAYAQFPVIYIQRCVNPGCRTVLGRTRWISLDRGLCDECWAKDNTS